MSPLRDDVSIDSFCTLALDHTEEENTDGPEEGCARHESVPHLGGDNHPSEQREGQQRVDDADVVPRHTNIRERPEQEGPVARAGVEQTVGRPTQCGGGYSERMLCFPRLRRRPTAAVSQPPTGIDTKAWVKWRW